MHNAHPAHWPGASCEARAAGRCQDSVRTAERAVYSILKDIEMKNVKRSGAQERPGSRDLGAGKLPLCPLWASTEAHLVAFVE